MRNFRNYEVWKKSMDFVEQVYRIVHSFPSFERYGIADQMRRAAVSIPSNIAEGASRVSDKEFVHFLHISMGSAFEVETQILIAHRLGYLSNESNLELMISIQYIEKKLNNLISSIQDSQKPKANSQ